MSDLSIFCDVGFGPEAHQVLANGINPHRLVLPVEGGGTAAANSTVAACDIAFGQPDIAQVLASQNTRWVHISSAGYTGYDTLEVRKLAQAKKIAITNSSSVFAEPCAEFVLACMLAQTRALVPALATHEREQVPFKTANMLRGAEVVILGYGAIAARLVAMLAPFGARVTGMRRRSRGDEGIPIVSPAELRAPLSRADHVVNILPENADSRHFVSGEFLAGMKRGAVFYNIGRGATVDQNALVSLLQSGHVGAAWLDVSDPEPLPKDHPLRGIPNCHLTPHVAGRHAQEELNLVRHFLDNFARFVEGTPLIDRVI